jgi:GH43 family beta-xylosidase
MRYSAVFIACLMLICCGSNTGDDPVVNPPVQNYLSLGSHTKTVNHTAGSFSVWINSNTNWKVESQNSWLVPDKTSGEGSVMVSVAYESTTENRRGSLRFSAEGVESETFVVNQTPATFSNPVFNTPDPWIVRHDGYFYICRSQSNGIGISKSDKLSVINGTNKVWGAPGEVDGVRPWNVGDIWAPELHYVDGRWYVYYAAGNNQGGGYVKQRAGVLRAKTDDPMGEWEDMGMVYTGDNYTPGIKPDADNTVYAIDMGVFELGGKLYAVWSGSAHAATDTNDRLFIATMENPYTINSSRVELARVEQSWERREGTIMEGPAFLHNKEAGKFFIVYSCNGSWTNKYCLGYLEMDDDKDPMNPANWRKSAETVFYRNDNTYSPTKGVNGVGHCSFTKSPDGTEDWIVYHVKDYSASGWDPRSTFMQKFTWNSDGTPDFGTPVAWGERLLVPSGEVE